MPKQPVLPAEEFKLTEAEIELLPLVEFAYERTRARRLMMTEEREAYEAVKACMMKHKLYKFSHQGLKADLEEDYDVHIAAVKEE